MRNYKLLTVWLLVGFTIYGCEIPKEPNFKTSNKVEAPVLFNKEFQFMGGDGNIDVLIDTTKSEFDSLFTVVPSGDSAGYIYISREEEFEFGDLNDAIPEIDAEGTDFQSEVGELELGSFGSGSGNLGEANFEDLTGISDAVQAGDPVPPQLISPEVTIDLDTDFFVSATFKSGSMVITLENNLGFNLDNINLTLISDPDPNVNGDEIDVVTDGTGVINDGETATLNLAFGLDDRLANPQVRVSIAWTSSVLAPQTFQRSPVSLVVQSAEGQNLIASRVVAALEGQDFSTSNSTSFSDGEFKFTDASHYVQLESGMIQIAPINNELDMDIDTLKISFPNIRRAPYNVSDSLVIRYVDSTALGGQDARILRNSSSTEKNISLEDVRLFATNNEITYNIYAVTENTQNAPVGDQNRVISEDQEISASVDISGLQIATAYGKVLPQTVLLGDDDPTNGESIIDVFNDTEAELTEISELTDISEQIDGLEFTDATLKIRYNTNIDIPTTVYASILGYNSVDDSPVYLSGKTADYQVADATKIDSLYGNGQPLALNQVIKFDIDPDPTGFGEIVFDSSTTNVNEFLNNLPDEIRFIGMAEVNSTGGVVTISTPLEFSPTFNVDLPLAFKTTTAATFSDTTETEDLADFPSPNKPGGGDDQQIKSLELIINYENGFPLAFGVDITFLDGLGQEIVTIPYPTDDPIELSAATVDFDSRFATAPNISSAVISITNQDDLDELYRTKSVVINASLNTTSNSEVKLRSTDKIKISASARITAEVTIN